MGPTASGKSKIAHEVARRIGGIEIVTVDSMQVYRGMDIGTAKPTPAMQTEVRYHLLDLVDPHQEFSVREFQQSALVAVADIEARGHRALLVGGTALYLRAVVDELDIPGQYPDIRAELELQEDVVALHRRLEVLDPVAAARMEPTNRRRIVRALEVCEGSGRAFSSYGDGLDTYPPMGWDVVVFDMAAAVAAERIAQRYREQLGEGFLAEVRRLVEAPRPLGRTAAQALGYRQFAAHLRGEVDLDAALDSAEAATRRFARRQRSWFRRDPRLVHIEVGGAGRADRVVAERVVVDLMERWGPQAPSSAQRAASCENGGL